MLREIVRTGVAGVLLVSVTLVAGLTSPLRAEDGGGDRFPECDLSIGR